MGRRKKKALWKFSNQKISLCATSKIYEKVVFTRSLMQSKKRTILFPYMRRDSTAIFSIKLLLGCRCGTVFMCTVKKQFLLLRFKIDNVIISILTMPCCWDSFYTFAFNGSMLRTSSVFYTFINYVTLRSPEAMCWGGYVDCYFFTISIFMKKMLLCSETDLSTVLENIAQIHALYTRRHQGLNIFCETTFEVILQSIHT